MFFRFFLELLSMFFIHVIKKMYDIYMCACVTIHYRLRLDQGPPDLMQEYVMKQRLKWLEQDRARVWLQRVDKDTGFSVGMDEKTI